MFWYKIMYFCIPLTSFIIGGVISGIAHKSVWAGFQAFAAIAGLWAFGGYCFGNDKINVREKEKRQEKEKWQKNRFEEAWQTSISPQSIDVSL